MRLRLIIPLFLLSIIFMPVQSAVFAEASCSDDKVGSYGRVRYDFVSNSNFKGKNIWLKTRSTVPNNSKLLIKIDDKCLGFDQDGRESNDWSWTPLKDGSTNYKIKSDKLSSGGIELIGVTGGIYVDKIIITDADCVPEGEGTNCYQKDEEVVIDYLGFDKLPDLKSYVSGKVSLSSNIEKAKDNISSIRYIENGAVIQHSKGFSPFDTTYLKDGEHIVYIEAFTNDKNIIKEYVSIKTYNPSTFLKPLMVWLRNHPEFKLFLYIVFFLITSYLLVYISYRIKKKKMMKEIMNGDFNKFK